MTHVKARGYGTAQGAKCQRHFPEWIMSWSARRESYGMCAVCMDSDRCLTVARCCAECGTLRITDGVIRDVNTDMDIGWDECATRCERCARPVAEVGRLVRTKTLARWVAARTKHLHRRLEGNRG